MKSNIINLESYSFNEGEKILLDTNIWLYLYPAPKNPSTANSTLFTKQYSEAFKNLITAKAQPVLDYFILSEYLNTYSRIEWNCWKRKYTQFKKFRNSDDFISVANSSKYFAKRILDCCEINSLIYKKEDLNNALNDFSTSTLDFNDAILVEICKQKNLTLMTNDIDFKNCGIRILTTNSKLLL